jgi:CrcB protein
MEPAHLVGTGGAIGAILRYLVGLALSHDRFPFATFVVNVLGSFVLGLVVFATLTDEVVLLVGTGVCGSFTTYSSFSVQTVQLWESGDRFRAILYAGGTLVFCLLAAAAGASVATIV